MEDVGWSHFAPLASLPTLGAPLADLLNRMFRNVGAERITVADALLHPWLTPAVPVGVPAGAMSDGEGVVAGLGGCEVSEGERAALVADMERRRAEVNRINAEEKEAARRAKQEARRCVWLGVVHTLCWLLGGGDLLESVKALESLCCMCSEAIFSHPYVAQP